MFVYTILIANIDYKHTMDYSPITRKLTRDHHSERKEGRKEEITEGNLEPRERLNPRIPELI